MDQEITVSASDHRNKIFKQIDVERYRQDRKWGGPSHDDKHSVRDWTTYIVVYLGRAVGPGTDWGRTLGLVRPLMINVAALSVAAIEAIDRKNGNA